METVSPDIAKMLLSRDFANLIARVQKGGKLTRAERAMLQSLATGTGTTMPAWVTAAGDASQAADLHARFAAITDPAEQTAFWRKLTPEQQALILNHQA